jgi:hypothetical protein
MNLSATAPCLPKIPVRSSGSSMLHPFSASRSLQTSRRRSGF